jgi:hypothetical protein
VAGAAAAAAAQAARLEAQQRQALLSGTPAPWVARLARLAAGGQLGQVAAGQAREVLLVPPPRVWVVAARQAEEAGAAPGLQARAALQAVQQHAWG